MPAQKKKLYDYVLRPMMSFELKTSFTQAPVSEVNFYLGKSISKIIAIKQETTKTLLLSAQNNCPTPYTSYYDICHGPLPLYVDQNT